MNESMLNECIVLMRQYEKTNMLIEMLAKTERKEGVIFSSAAIAKAIAETASDVFTRPDIEYKKELMEHTELDNMFKAMEQAAKDKNIKLAKSILKQRNEIIRNIKSGFKGLKFYVGNN